jgi:hypothetical protein
LEVKNLGFETADRPNLLQRAILAWVRRYELMAVWKVYRTEKVKRPGPVRVRTLH